MSVLVFGFCQINSLKKCDFCVYFSSLWPIFEWRDCYFWSDLENYLCICTRPYSQNVVVSCSRGLSWEHNSASGVDGEFSLVVSVHDAVGQPSVGAFVSVEGRHSEHGFSLPPSLSLRYLDLVDLLREDGLVVVLVQDSDRHPGGAVSRTFTAVWHQNLENRVEWAVALVATAVHFNLFYTIYLHSSHHRVTLVNICWTPLWWHIHFLISIFRLFIELKDNN